MFPKTNWTRLLLCLFLLLFSFAGQSQVLRGVVLDAKTGEPMSGATVVVKRADEKEFKQLNSDLRQYVQLDGYFTFRNLAAGEYVLEVTFANYKKHAGHVSVGK